MKKLLILIALCAFLPAHADQKVFTSNTGDIDLYRSGDYLYIGRLVKIDTVSCLPAERMCYSNGTIKKQWEIIKCPDQTVPDKIYRQAIQQMNQSVVISTKTGVERIQAWFLAVAMAEKSLEKSVVYKSGFTTGREMIIIYTPSFSGLPRLTVIFILIFVLSLSIIMVQKMGSGIMEYNALFTKGDSATVPFGLFIFLMLFSYSVARIKLFWWYPNVEYVIIAAIGLLALWVLNTWAIDKMRRKVQRVILYGVIRRSIFILSFVGGIMIYYATTGSISYTVQLLILCGSISLVVSGFLYGPSLWNKGAQLIDKFFPKKKIA